MARFVRCFESYHHRRFPIPFWPLLQKLRNIIGVPIFLGKWNISAVREIVPSLICPGRNAECKALIFCPEKIFSFWPEPRRILTARKYPSLFFFIFLFPSFSFFFASSILLLSFLSYSSLFLFHSITNSTRIRLNDWKKIVM